jgi:hypothetical protein
MEKTPLEVLREGCTILDPLMTAHGFLLENTLSGKGSGGRYAKAEYVNGRRQLEFHYRYSLGLVTYHFEKISIDHESYMRAVLGDKGGNRYPGFSDDPITPFRDLTYDLENFAGASLEDDFEEFGRCAEVAKERKKIPGFVRIP